MGGDARPTEVTLIGCPMKRTCLIAVVAALAVSGCTASGDRRAPSSPATSTNGPSSRHNANDAAFLRLEVAHHGQAIELADIALHNSHNPRVRSIARHVKAVQSSERTSMQRRLQDWRAESDNHGHTHEPPGNLNAEQMASLRRVMGGQFDRYWCQQMVFHEMATSDMADTERQQGVDPATKRLASTLDAAQDRLVDQLLDLLKTFPQ
jgi:uncharacterized protein (DUF305 family)